MSYANINGAQIYYDTYGVDPPDRPRVPLLLIHGAGSTGQTDWREVAPLLARHYKVVVPDCRGHGRSTNPGWSYHFREMAEDLAELVHRLGYARAHVAGHGNGGNIALVMLLERSDVVQTCTLQAANASVSADLLEIQGEWEAERLASEAPGWAREIMALHAPMHGRDYWRELWQLTLAESFSQPNYTEEDLALVTRPVLVIQGELDRINVPGRHGTFLTRHVPDAEAWFPVGVGNAVRREIPSRWIERMLDFLARRGDDANEALDRLRRQYYFDARVTVFTLKAEYTLPADDAEYQAIPLPPAELAAGDALAGIPLSDTLPEANGDSARWRLRLAGRALVAAQCEAAVSAIAGLSQIAGRAVSLTIEDEVRVLLQEATPTASVKCPLVDLHHAPDISAERVSQALAGETLRVLEEQDGWAHVRLDNDGTLGWLQSATLQPGTVEIAASCVENPSWLVVAQAASAYAKPSRNSHHMGKLAFGTILPAAACRGRWVALRLPDGVAWWVPDSDLLPLAKRPRPDAAGVAKVLKLLASWVGVPYLQGGRTPFGIDAAGLAQVFLGFLGIQAPRCADQQFQCGHAVTGRPEPGDLVFFAHETADEDLGHAIDTRCISHVAISMGGYRLLQAGGGALSVNVISLGRPRTPAETWLRAHLVGARRLAVD